MAEFRAHEAGLVRIPIPPTFRAHAVALVHTQPPVEGEFRAHRVVLVHGFESPVGVGAKRVRWQGAWVEAITRVRYGGAWI